MNKNRIIQVIILSCLACCLLSYTSVRAHLLSMTHDEAHTFNAFMQLDIWSCFWNPECWEIANNHLLNSWLIQKSTSLFGVSEFTIRLPNLLAHLMYLISSIIILLQTSRNLWLLIFGFCLINMNPYLLDFFSLARGYGLFTGFLMAGILGYFKFLKRPTIPLGILLYAMLLLAIFSNFTALNPAFCLLVLYIITIFYFFRNSIIDRKYFIQLMAIPLVWLILLGLFLYIPITTLKGQGEFLWGTPYLWQTFQTLIGDSLYHEAYFGKETLVIFFTSLILAGIGILFWCAIVLLKKPRTTTNLFFIAMCLLLFGSVLFMLLQHLILGSQYLINRKAIHFIPLISLTFYLLIATLPKFNAKIILVLIASAFLCNHLIRTYNLTGTREWYYDTDTREMMIDLNALKIEGQSLSLGLNWLFMPSSKFYKSLFDYNFIEPLVYSKTILKDRKFDYYYIESGDYQQLEEHYEIFKRYGGGRLFLKRK